MHTMIVYLHMLHVSACINTKHMYLIKLDMLLIMAPWTPSMCQFPTLKLFDVEQTSNLTFVSPQFYWEKTTKARFNQSTFASSPVVPVPFAWDPAIQDTGPHLWKLSVANTCSIARFTWFQKHVYVSCVCKDRINLYIYVYPWKGNLPTTHTEGILGYRNHSLKNFALIKTMKRSCPRQWRAYQPSLLQAAPRPSERNSSKTIILLGFYAHQPYSMVATHCPNLCELRNWTPFASNFLRWATTKTHLLPIILVVQEGSL